MGATCARAVEPHFGKSPRWLQDGALSPGGFEEAEVDKFLREGHEQGALEATLERWAFGSASQNRFPRLQLQGPRSTKLSPVMLHLYNSTAPGLLLAATSTDKFHSGVEVHGREWSFWGAAACPGEATGVFVSAPRGCMGAAYSTSVSMGTTTASQDEVLEIISSMKKDWCAASFKTFSRNSYHFCRDLCGSLDVDTKIPDWVARLALGESDPSCSGQITQILCCSRLEVGRGEPQLLEQISTVAESPVKLKGTR